MHEISVIRKRHFLSVYGPATICADYLSVIRIFISGPVLCVNEIRSFKSLLLIVFHFSVAYESRIKLITFRMSDNKLIICSVHPFGKAVWNGLRQWFRMRSPSHDYLRTSCFLIFLYRDQVGETLQRMACRRFHAKYRPAGMLDELTQYLFVIIIFFILKACERTDPDHIAVTAHYRNSFQQMLRFITIHDNTSLCFQLPCTLVNVQNDRVHT